MSPYMSGSFGGSVSIGSITIDDYTVIDQMDTPLLDASSTNIPASSAAPLTVVATLAADTERVELIDTTGGFIGLYSDPAGSPVLEAVFGPGNDKPIPLYLAAGSTIGLRNLEDAALDSGNVAINFYG